MAKEIKDRVLRNEKISWRALKPFQPDNLKTMSKESFEILKNSITERNFAASFKVWEEKGEYWILDGHHRKYALEALEKDGYKLPEKFNCEVIDCKDSKEANELLLTYSSSHAKLDQDGLFEFITVNDLEWDDLKKTLDLPGVDLDKLQKNNVEVCEPQTDEDDLPELRIEATSKLGDIWILGKHRLMCGDSTCIDSADLLMDSAKGDMVFTDPPYGYSYESNYYKGENPYGMLKNDDSIIDFMPVLFATLNENAAIYICGSHQTMHKWRDIIDQHFKYKNLIVWKKNNWSMGDLKGAYAGQHELIFFAHKGKVSLRGERHRDVWEFDRDPPKEHPTQKPVEMVEFAINNTSDVGNIIIDLFGGSGSTLIACEKTNRKCYMMELDPRYCDVIVKRYVDYVGSSGKVHLLLSDGKTIPYEEVFKMRPTKIV